MIRRGMPCCLLLVLAAAIWGLAFAPGLVAEPPTASKLGGPRAFHFQQPWVGVAVNPTQIVRQQEVSEYACGPASILHALRLGNERMQAAAKLLPGKNGPAQVQRLIDDRANQPSREYTSGRRWRADGISARDLTDIYNEVLEAHQLPKAEGMYLNRGADEKPERFLRRIHGRLAQSLEQGIPVIVFLRSFAAQMDGAPDAGKDPKEIAFHWKGLSGHYVLITKAPGALHEHQRGFPFEFVDSWSGRLEEGYISVETIRNFTAAKGNVEQWEWLRDFPFLLVTVPSLPLRTGQEPWWTRTTVVLNYGLFGADRKP